MFTTDTNDVEFYNIKLVGNQAFIYFEVRITNICVDENLLTLSNYVPQP